MQQERGGPRELGWLWEEAAGRTSPRGLAGSGRCSQGRGRGRRRDPTHRVDVWSKEVPSGDALEAQFLLLSRLVPSHASERQAPRGSQFPASRVARSVVANSQLPHSSRPPPPQNRFG